MTAWLDWRTEPMTKRPEISVEVRDSTVIHLSCDDPDCDWYSDVMSPSEMDEFASNHQDWHENGMPQ